MSRRDLFKLLADVEDWLESETQYCHAKREVETYLAK
jgi:hypothetical protein